MPLKLTRAQLALAQASLGLTPSTKPRRQRRKPRAPKNVLVTVAGSVATLHALPIVTLNSRMHHFERARWNKPFRAAARTAAEQLGIVAPGRVVMVRITPHSLLDTSDNLPGALKAVQDGIAEATGIDDRDPRWVWVHEQRREPGAPGRVEITRMKR